MKIYKFNIIEPYLSKFFKPIRGKIDVIEVLMEAINYINMSSDIPKKDTDSKIILNVDKMSRIFFFTDKKYFSLTFPFLVRKLESGLKFTFNGYEIHAGLTSQVLSIIKSDEFKGSCSFNFAEQIYDYDKTCDEDFWLFFRELLLMEDGYIRYDYDKENHDIFKANGEEHKHPLNHYDLFYSDKSTFKIGLENIIDSEDFIDLLNINTNCKYITTAGDKYI